MIILFVDSYEMFMLKRCFLEDVEANVHGLNPKLQYSTYDIGLVQYCVPAYRYGFFYKIRERNGTHECFYLSNYQDG